MGVILQRSEAKKKNTSEFLRINRRMKDVRSVVERWVHVVGLISLHLLEMWSLRVSTGVSVRLLREPSYVFACVSVDDYHRKSAAKFTGRSFCR